MKFNIEFDFEDMYAEYDDHGCNLNDIVKDHIITGVKNFIWKDFQEKALTEFSTEVRKELDSVQKGRIQEMTINFFENSKVRRDYGGDMVTMKEAVEKMLSQASVNNSDFMTRVQSHINSEAKKIGEELRKRYDVMFASQIVVQLSEQGLLKDGMSNLLAQMKKDE